MTTATVNKEANAIEWVEPWYAGALMKQRNKVETLAIHDIRPQIGVLGFCRTLVNC
jgi:hypothetical protein